MRRSAYLGILCRAVIAGSVFAVLSNRRAASAEDDAGSKRPPPCTSAGLPVPPYDPYPPGILPNDLNSEITRVQCEVQNIEKESLAEWRALPPPTKAGNPPTLQGRHKAIEILGKLLNFDENTSPFRNEACAFCHTSRRNSFTMATPRA